MIDGHIHYASMLNPRKLNELIRRENLGGVALQCIPKADDLPVEEDAFAFAAQAKVPVYVFGGLRRELYRLSEPELSGALVREAERLMDRGCAGIKMLEGKPQIRKPPPARTPPGRKFPRRLSRSPSASFSPAISTSPTTC